jgi:hypothetical protein
MRAGGPTVEIAKEAGLVISTDALALTSTELSDEEPEGSLVV